MSMLTHLGVGTVTQTKQTNTDEIMVFIPKYFPLADGELTADPVQEQQTSKNAKGEDETSNVLISSSHPAYWMRENSNRINSPDVRVGSKVNVYRISDQDKLYWTTSNNSSEDMRLETAIFGFSANPKTDENAPFSYDDFYVFEVSSHSKKISVRTSMGNGEKCKMELSIDPGNGMFSYVDNEHNTIGVDAMNHHLFLTNEEKSLIEINKKVITIVTDDVANIASTNAINITTKTINVQTKTVVMDTETISIKSNQIGIENSGDTIIATNGFKMASPTWSITGEGTIIGNLKITKGIEVAEMATGSGGSTFKVPDLQSATVASYNLHIHGNGNNGSPTTKPE